MQQDNERRVLSKEEALAMLPFKKHVHTFRQAGPILIGADWDRKAILDALDKFEFELTGEQAQSMGHGMAFCDTNGWVFVETIKAGGEPSDTESGKCKNKEETGPAAD